MSAPAAIAPRPVPAPIPANEAARLAALHAYGVLDSLPEQAYDDLTALAGFICDSPMALVSLVDADRQWFKSRVGLEASETSRSLAFCAHAIMEPGRVFVVPDATKDPRFAGNPLVTDDPHIRFYAGAPLVTPDGLPVGTICVIDQKPRPMRPHQLTALRALSRQVVALLELRKTLRQVEAQADALRSYSRQLEKYQRALEESNALLEQMSTTDGLTGARNRRGFEEALEGEKNRSRRYKQEFSLLMIDVDHFKTYNDSFGHPAGDHVLTSVVRLLESERRVNDIVARVGGEEFAVLLPNTGAEGAAVLAERFRLVVAEAEWRHRPITVSIGFATQPCDPDFAGDVVARADAALYRAKESGRNRVKGPGGAGTPR